MKIIRRIFNTLFAKRYIALLACLFVTCSFQQVLAQLRLVPLSDTNVEAEIDFELNARTNASLALPFFDDFSTTKTNRPDTRYWLPGSGVYINNTLSNSQPSQNLATFDGLNASGVPYNLVNPLNQNFTDTLTSQPINMAGRAAGDSVYLSFYWQAKGVGELPDSSDYLSVEFLDRSNQWKIAWTRNGYKVDTLFHHQFVRISDAAFFHGAFQFRFRSYGRNSGSYDNWNLDYVHLNAKRSARQPYIFDVALRKPVSQLLKRYTAMPLRQFLVNPAAALSDSVRTDVVNNFNNFNVLTSTYTITDEVQKKELFRNTQRSILVESLKSKSLSAKVPPITFNAAADSAILTSKFYLTTTDTILGVNLKYNDTITSRTALSDYFAFDDGSAEYGIQMNQKLGRVAVQYVLSEPDTIGGVRIAVMPFNKDIAGQSFTVQIIGNANGKPGQVLAQRSVPTSYASGRDGFIDFAFVNAVTVPDTFYIGWQQINEQPLTIGFDRNTMQGRNSIFYNLGTEWARETSLSGSIMIRPYLGRNAQEVVTGTEPSAQQFFFPNPSTGVIQWKCQGLKKIEVFSTNGRMVTTILPAENQQITTLDQLSPGIYILKATDGKRTFTQKMLIAK